MIRLRPLHDLTVIRRIEESEQTRGWIYIPETVRKKPQQGQVVAVGDGQILENGNRIPPVLKIEDRVFFDKSAGTEVLIDDEEYLIMRENEILGIIEEAATAMPAKK